MVTSQAESHHGGCPYGNGNSHTQTFAGRLAVSHGPIRPSTPDQVVFRKPGTVGQHIPLGLPSIVSQHLSGRLPWATQTTRQ